MVIARANGGWLSFRRIFSRNKGDLAESNLPARKSAENAKQRPSRQADASKISREDTDFSLVRFFILLLHSAKSGGDDDVFLLCRSAARQEEIDEWAHREAAAKRADFAVTKWPIALKKRLTRILEENISCEWLSSVSASIGQKDGFRDATQSRVHLGRERAPTFPALATQAAQFQPARRADLFWSRSGQFAFCALLYAAVTTLGLRVQSGALVPGCLVQN